MAYDYDSGFWARTTIIKHHPPCTTAQIFWLKNRRPDLWRDVSRVEVTEDQLQPDLPEKTYDEFVAATGYPSPYPKQHEMRSFAIDDADEVPRLLLGARKYGKTDFVTILGAAYKLYCDPEYRILLCTKSEERNASILGEVAAACEANGMVFFRKNAMSIRLKGLRGKDHSMSSITLGSSGIRGRHPDLIIMDDPVTPEDTSEATRKKAEDVYDELYKLCKNIVLIGQPVHKFDLYEKLRGIVKKMEVPHGTIPELDDDLEAMRLAGVSMESISASYHLKVISVGGLAFENIQYLDTMPVGDTVAWIDPSCKGGDHTALSIYRGYFDGIAVQGNCWKRAWYDCMDEMGALFKRYNVKRIGFETNALGEQPLIQLRQAFPHIGVIGKASTNNKHSRIMAAGSYSKSIHLARTSDSEYTRQVTKYEYGSEPDDAPDSLATGLEWMGLIRGKSK